MEIRIMSHLSMQSFLGINAKEWDVVCVTNSGSLILEDVQKYSKSYIELLFDDIDCPLTNYILPNKHDVYRTLEYAKDKKRLVITCAGGVSRSPALAYAVKCQEYGDAKKASDVLIPIKHHPNRLIIKFASELLHNESVYDVYEEWLQKSVLFPIRG